MVRLEDVRTGVDGPVLNTDVTNCPIGKYLPAPTSVQTAVTGTD